jgi:hypothetical protein
MMPNNTPTKHSPSRRELREERARAFWQAQINEGRAQRAEEQPKTNKPAALRQDPERPAAPQAPPHPVPLHVVSPDTDSTGTTPPISPPDIPALFLAATSVLRLINAGTPDGRRFSAAPQAKDRAAWRLVQTAVPTLTDKAAQDVIDSWLRAKVIETRSYHDPVDRRHYPGLFVTPLEVCLRKSPNTLPHPCAPHASPSCILLLHAVAASMFLCSTPDIRWPAPSPEIRPFIVERATTFGCGSLPVLGECDGTVVRDMAGRAVRGSGTMLFRLGAGIIVGGRGDGRVCLQGRA